MAGFRGANCVLNLAFRVAKESILPADSSENHSNASPVKEVEKTRHQMGSLTAWNIIWCTKTRMWLSGLVVPSYLSNVGIFHFSGSGVSKMYDVKGENPDAGIGWRDGRPPSFAPELSAIVCDRFPLEAYVFSTRADCDCSCPVGGGRLSTTRLASRCCCTGLNLSGSGTVGVDGIPSSFRLRMAFSSRKICICTS